MGSYSTLHESLLPDEQLRNGRRKESHTSTVRNVETRSSNYELVLDNHAETGRTVIVAEIKKAGQLAWPLITFNVVVFSVPVTTLMFVGHLGELELSAASIASSFAVVTAFTVMMGLGSTLETLCGQAYGAKQYRMMGIYLQSAWIVCSVVSLLILAIWMNVARIFTAMGQDPEVARMAERYLLFMVPGVFGSGILRPMVKFLQSQSVVRPVLICSFIALIFHLPTCYFCIHKFGFVGGSIATAFSYQFLTVLIALYIWWSNQFTETFQGFTWEAFGMVKEYLKLAIPSTAMLCLEYWTAEILVLAAGLLRNPQLQLSLLSISLSATYMASMIPNGLGGAAGTRVANELGAYRPDAAKVAAKVVMGISLLSSGTVAACILITRGAWGKAFTSVDEVLESVRHITPLIALSALMEGIQGVLSGIARGCGRQDMGTYINLAAFYLVGIPSGLYLGFRLDLAAEGLWIGLLLGEIVQTSLLAMLVIFTSWEKMAEDAVKRVALDHKLPTTSENKEQD